MQIHGGDIYQNNVELDFSANINPFGMPKRVEEAAMEGVRESVHYPDLRCCELKEAIAQKENVPAEWIFCGNGAAEVIFQLVQARNPKKAVLVYPTFSEYEQALSAAGCEIIKVLLKKEEGFLVTESLLDHLNPSVDLMFLCNPNNPTGITVDSRLLTRILNQCTKAGILLVLDECFQDFLSVGDQDSQILALSDHPNLFVLKAFTKMYGMAGLRLGYGVSSNQRLINCMKEITQPWNVSIPAQKAGIAACEEEEFAKMTREYIAIQRQTFLQGLKNLGLTVYDSKANYIFFEGPKGLYEACLEHGILIRSCASYEGLGDTYYRIAVKRKEQNERFLEVLKRVMEEKYG